MPVPLPELKVIQFVHYRDDQSWNYPVNYYPFNTLYFVLSGDGFVRVRDVTLPLKAGYAYLIPANTLFSCWCETHIHKLYVDMTLEAVPGLDVFAGLRNPVEAPVPIDDIHEMIRCVESESIKHRLCLNGLLLKSISLFLGDGFQLENPEVLRFKQILDDIGQNLTARTSIADIAAKHNQNPTTLSRKFKKAFSRSLKQYLDRLLAERIQRELLFTSKTVKEIAESYQFSDQYNLSNFFKRLVGVSPTRYRVENRKD